MLATCVATCERYSMTSESVPIISTEPIGKIQVRALGYLKWALCSYQTQCIYVHKIDPHEWLGINEG